MPVYEYRCSACGNPEEHLQTLGAGSPEAGCAECGAPLTRRYSRVAVRYGGWGFKSTDTLVSRPGRGDYKALRERAERISDES